MLRQRRLDAAPLRVPLPADVAYRFVTKAELIVYAPYPEYHLDFRALLASVVNFMFFARGLTGVSCRVRDVHVDTYNITLQVYREKGRAGRRDPTTCAYFSFRSCKMGAEELDQERDLLRIMISTDNHLGVNEEDPVRGEDSFRAFEEVLQKAVEARCDMVLLGGDLFHDNTPSRATMHKTVRILKKYCMSDAPVSFQILSDQADNFPSTGVVNYEDPNYNIGLPIFTIHGNHDDPTGAGRLSAVDILAQCALVNYFGNMELEGSGIGKLHISPILLRKGQTHVALYGLGNIRDERLARLFKTPGNVQWNRPEEHAGEWFSVFVLHQNREARTKKNFVEEACLPKFMDLVVWGHEHQCMPETTLSKAAGGETEILQAGSTVPTSLSEGEADPKHCFIYEVMGLQFRMTKVPLETVRPFLYGHAALSSVDGLESDDVKGIEAFLEERVNQMIAEANSCERAAPLDSGPMLPLIRLRVDYTGFSTINVQRFGQRFVKRVANPQDILIFSKHAARQQQAEQQGAGYGEPMEGLRPEQLDQARIEDLIAEHLGPGASLEVLLEDELRVALHHFVDKDERQALEACVKGLLQRLQSDMEQGGQGKEGLRAEAMEELIRLRALELGSQARPEAAAGEAEPGGAGASAGGGAAAEQRPAAAPPAAPPQTPSQNRLPAAAAAAAAPSASAVASGAQRGGLDTFFKPAPRQRAAARAASSIGSAHPGQARSAARRAAATAGREDGEEDPVKLTQTSAARPRRAAAARGVAARRTRAFTDDDSDEIAGSEEDEEYDAAGGGDGSDGIMETEEAEEAEAEEEEEEEEAGRRGRRGKPRARKAAATPPSGSKRARTAAWGSVNADSQRVAGSAMKKPAPGGEWPPRARRAAATPAADEDVEVMLLDSDEEEAVGAPVVRRGQGK
eukprot:jgi/Tetstr1/464784/TSEL_009530.t1